MESKDNEVPAIPLTLALAAFVVAIFVGLVVGVGLWPTAALVAIVVGITVTFVYGPDNLEAINKALFWLMIFLLIVVPITEKITGRSLSFLLELALIAAFPQVAKAVWSWAAASKTAQALGLFFVLFLAISIVSSVSGRSTAAAAVYQLLSNMKFFAMVAFGFLGILSGTHERYFWTLIRWLWLPLLLLVLLQWAAPEAYVQLWSSAATDELNSPNPLVNNGLTRATGFFTHPSVLGAIASLFSIICICRALARCEINYVFIALVYAFLIVASGQRQELIAGIVAMAAAVGFLASKRRPLVGAFTVSTVGACIGLLGLLLLVPDNIIGEARNWGLGTYVSSSSARAVLYADAIEIANEYWPLGSGLGTFASAGSAKFDVSYYLDKGYTTYWWFMQKDFLMDAFWTRYIAETGWVGAFLMLVNIPVMLWYVSRKYRDNADRDADLYWVLAFAGLVFALVASPTSYILSEPDVGLFAFLFFGVAITQYSARAHHNMRSASKLTDSRDVTVTVESRVNAL